MKIQIYTMQTAAEAVAAAAAGVDYLGVTPSNRGLPGEISFAAAREIVDALEGKAQRVALSVESDLDDIAAMVEAVRPDVLHLCGDIALVTPEKVEVLRARLLARHPALRILQAIPMTGPEALDHACCENELLRSEDDLLSIALDDHRPFLGRFVVSRRLAGGGTPIIELHHLGIHLQPVADLVLRRKDRPVFREGNVGQMVVPDRVVQAERLVALAPAVARAFVLLDNDRRHAQLPQPRGERNSPLAAADDDDIRLGRVTEFGRFRFALFLPGLAVGVMLLLAIGDGAQESVGRLPRIEPRLLHDDRPVGLDQRSIGRVPRHALRIVQIVEAQMHGSAGRNRKPVRARGLSVGKEQRDLHLGRRVSGVQDTGAFMAETAPVIRQRRTTSRKAASRPARIRTGAAVNQPAP